MRHPKTGGSFIRQPDGSLKPAAAKLDEPKQETARIEQDDAGKKRQKENKA
jgi:hypothetical protein